MFGQLAADSEFFNNKYTDVFTDASIAAPSSSGEPLLLAGDVGAWGVFEQQIDRVPPSDDRGIGIFARVAGAPADRNLIDLYVFFSSRRRHTRCSRDWSSDVCSSD